MPRATVSWQSHVIHGTIHTKAFDHVLGTQIGADGRAYMRFANDGSGDRAHWPFDSPQYLLPNLAVGGWGGQQGIDAAAFPAEMDVDYVRVWQR